MGQQQLLLIIIGVIIVGIAIAVGIALFGSSSVSANKDALVNDLQNLATDAFQYKVRPTSLGGGGGKYAGFKIPVTLQSTEDGTFDPKTAVSTQQSVTFVATSAHGYGTVTAVCDSIGKLGNFTYTGEFL